MHDDIIAWLTEEGGQVAIFDANVGSNRLLPISLGTDCVECLLDPQNGTIKQREELRSLFGPKGIHMFFIGAIGCAVTCFGVLISYDLCIESILDKREIIEANIKA